MRLLLGLWACALCLSPLFIFASELLLSFDAHHVVAPGQILYVPIAIKNDHFEPMESVLDFRFPEDWCALMGLQRKIQLDPNESTVEIIAVKVPADALAGSYEFSLSRDGKCQSEISVIVISTTACDATIEGLLPCYGFGESVSVDVVCWNDGNTPLRAFLEVDLEPFCDLDYHSEIFEITPHSSLTIPICIQPTLERHETRRTLVVRVIEENTCDVLAVCPCYLLFASAYNDVNDPYIRIPSEASVLVIGDRNKLICAAEIIGSGMIDEDCERYLEYYLLQPTDHRLLFYDVEQTFYIGVGQPGWDAWLGDGSYSLTPLTQRYRYGRGAEFDMYGDCWSWGAHYTQSPVNGTIAMRELCGYIEATPYDCLSISGNCINTHFRQCPSATIMSIESNIESPQGIYTTVEIAKNCSGSWNETAGYRIETCGTLCNDAWIDIEEIYAEPQFEGYYQNINLFSAALDVPLLCRLRAHASYNQLRQNVIACDQDDDDALAPRQRQINGNLTYTLCNGNTFSLTGLELRARDAGPCYNYDFDQQWGGFNYGGYWDNYWFQSIVSFGRQEDFRRHQNTPFLQRYCLSAGRDFLSRLSGSVGWESGNINYYDARPWHTTYSVNLGYQYSPRGRCDAFVQRVTDSCPRFRLTQTSFNIRHIFSNYCVLQILAQLFCYQHSRPDNFLLSASFTVPFGAPIARRTDIGAVDVCVYDTWNQCPVPASTLALNNQCTTANTDGHSVFSSLPIGEHLINVPILPDNLITYDQSPKKIQVQGGKTLAVTVPVLPSCSLTGTVTLPNIRITITRDHYEEILTTVSDPQGSFSFPKLRPGKWTISANEHHLPEHHYFNVNNITVEIEPEENKHVFFLPIPDERTYRTFEE